MDTQGWTSLAAFAALNLAAASSGGLFKPGAWYAALNRPAWTPPNWAFPLVWLVMFSLNTVAGWLVWQAHGTAALPVLAIYAASLVVNAAWSFLFFGRRRMDLALIDVALLWLSILAVIVAFSPLRPFAALLLVPYLVWVSVAALLNLRMIQLNRAAAST